MKNSKGQLRLNYANERYGSCTLYFSSSIYLTVRFLVDTSYISVLCSAQYICKFSETTGPTEAFHVTPPWERGKMESLFKMI